MKMKMQIYVKWSDTDCIKSGVFNLSFLAEVSKWKEWVSRRGSTISKCHKDWVEVKIAKELEISRHVVQDIKRKQADNGRISSMEKKTCRPSEITPKRSNKSSDVMNIQLNINSSSSNGWNRHYYWNVNSYRKIITM